MSAVARASVSAPVARPRVGPIFSGLMLVVLLAALDQTIVATALLRRLARELCGEPPSAGVAAGDRVAIG